MSNPDKNFRNDRNDRTVRHDETPIRHDDAAAVSSDRRTVDDRAAVRNDDLLEREKAKYGGVKIGSAFLGWLTAFGVTAILTAFLTGILTAIGLAAGDTITAGDVQTASIVSAIVVLVILFIAYYVGGYVAGRMARFEGLKQGLAVWGWAVAIAILVWIVAALAGPNLNVLANLNVFPQIPTDTAGITTTWVVTAILAVLVALGGAVLGGKQGTDWHRKVDRAGL